MKLITLLSIFGWIIMSWILIHIFALLGIFLAVAYPIWWLFLPKQTICFICRSRKDGQRCHFCKRIVIKQEGYFPKNLLSSIYNGGLILVFSLVSIGIIFIESKVLLSLGFSPTPKTVSFIIPTKNQYRLGEIFPMDIEIVGIKVPINSVQADLGFDPSRVEVIDISTENSFANIFIQKEINNEVGYARITGGLANPGFSQSRGIFATIFFKGIRPGLLKIDYLENSMVLANDRLGTNVLKDLASVSYLILPEQISEEEKELQRNLTFNSPVLGKSTDTTQMKFYEESNVLGAYLPQQEPEVKNKNIIIDTIFNALGKFNQFILDFWHKTFDTVIRE